MKFPLMMNKTFATRTLIFLMCVVALTISVSAQKSSTRTLSTTWDKLLAPEAIGVDIEQCANGPLASPIPCNTAGGNEGYVRGNLVSSKSHYKEGDSVPIRIVATGLEIGVSYSVTIGYDYTKGGKYATDYLTSFDRTETLAMGNNPCVGVANCSLGTFTTAPIPVDPEVTNGFNQLPGGGDDIVQIPGVFTCFSCTITNVSTYTRSGSQAGDSSKSITVTFTADQTSIVLAYGSHISTRSDWGQANSAINISGSPYHNFIVDFPGANSGNRDLQLSAEAVIFPADVTIIKSVTTNLPGFPPGDTSTFRFDFTSTLGGFFLIDDQAGSGGGGTASTSFSGITAFGSANTIIVTENAYENWTLAGISCVSNPNGGTGTNNNTDPAGPRNVGIVLEEGESVTCTFHNTQLGPTAAAVSVSGQVVDSFGRGISGARLTITDAQTGTIWSTQSNTFGYYTLSGPAAGGFYMMSIYHRRYTFADSERAFTLNEDLAGVDFIANP